MTEYIIQAREKCPACNGAGQQSFSHATDPEEALVTIECTCRDGYVYREVPLVGVLGKVRFDLHSEADTIRLFGLQLGGVRIEE